MTDKATLRQATLISEQKVVPGTGTLTGITVSAPITGGGAGPVVPIGATQHDATHPGFLPAGPIGVSDGGTGADLSGLSAGQMIAFDGTKFMGVDLIDVATAPGNSATNTLFFSATNGSAVTSNASIGVDLSFAAGTLVMLSGGAGASTPGSNSRLTLSGNSGTMQFDSSGYISGLQDITAALVLNGTEDSPTPVGVGMVFGAGFSGANTDLTGYLWNQSGGVPGNSMFFNGTVGGISITENSSPYFTPLAGIDLRSTVTGLDALHVSSLSGISLLAQTSSTDGSNSNETFALKGNTAQTSPLMKGYGTDGSTPVMVVDIDGNVSVIRGVPLVWPAANAAGVLTNDGSGNLSWV